MPAYGTNTVQALYKGSNIQLITAADATAGNVTTTQAVAIGPEPGAAARTIVVVNSTNQQATLKAASADTGSNAYQSLSGAIIPAGTALPYNLSGGYVLANFSVAPSSGTLVIEG